MNENLEVVLKVVKSGLELVVALLGDRSPAALDAADDAVRAMLEGVNGETSAELVAQELLNLQDGIKANDDAADKALADKFDTGGEGG